MPSPLPSYECLLDRACTATMVAAHRGFHLVHPENSLAAIRAAAEVGASFAEIDVRHTADEQLVLMHDDTVDRTTDGSGEVSALSYAEIAALRLSRGAVDDPESSRVPRFGDALALAQELGMMLYVDQKTDRTARVVQAIAAGPFYDTALLRNDLDAVVEAQQQDARVLVMPAVDSEATLGDAMARTVDLYIVELSAAAADPAFTSAAAATEIKVQQDVMAAGDVLGMFGDYTGYEPFVAAGVSLLQTDLPDVLVPAVRELNATGAFPAQGPGRL